MYNYKTLQRSTYHAVLTFPEVKCLYSNGPNQIVSWALNSKVLLEDNNFPEDPFRSQMHESS